MSIILDKVNYSYSEGTAYQTQALKDINLEIKDGQFVGIIGHTGSGKSTLMQLLNGLLKATTGNIYVDGRDIYEEDYDRDWCSSIRIISFLRQRTLRMCVLDRRIRGWIGKRWSFAHTRRCRVWDFPKNYIISRLLICPEDRNAVWQLREFWQ